MGFGAIILLTFGGLGGVEGEFPVTQRPQGQHVADSVRKQRGGHSTLELS